MTDQKTQFEHIEWCKARALAYLPGSPKDAMSSMLSDLVKHPESATNPAIELGMMMMMSGHLDTASEAKRFIEGF